MEKGLHFPGETGRAGPGRCGGNAGKSCFSNRRRWGREWRWPQADQLARVLEAVLGAACAPCACTALADVPAAPLRSGAGRPCGRLPQQAGSFASDLLANTRQ